MNMNRSRDDALKGLKRLLANGPLTAVPKRPSDQDLLVALAAAQFDAQETYREKEVNEKLKSWLQSFCEPFGIDHVTLRRMLVDSRLVSRTKTGSMYQVNPERAGDIETLGSIAPSQLLAEIRAEREARKHRRA